MSVGTNSYGNYSFLLSMWKQCKVTPEQVENAYQTGKLTVEERNQILATPRDCP